MYLTERSNSLKGAYYVAIGAVVVLLIGSLAWYKQRMLFIDPAWIVYRIIDTRNFCIAEHRYGAVATQVVPLIGAYLHWPMRTILMLYSASFYVFYLIVMLIAGTAYGHRAFGILLALYLLLMVSDNFFWPNNEVHQGIGWMFLALAIFFGKRGRQQWRVWEYALFPTCLFLAIFSHFIVIIPLCFLWIFCLLDNTAQPRSRYRIAQVVAGSACILVLFLVKYELGRNSWYDGGKLAAVKTLSLQAIVASFTNGHARMIAVLFLKNYWLLILIFIVGLMILASEKKYLQALLTIGFATGYFSLICMTYPEPFRPELRYYIESEWVALTIIVAAPAVFYVLPKMRGAMAVAAMLLVCAIRLAYICDAYGFFNRRLMLLSSLTKSLHQAHISKAVITMDGHARDIVFYMDWGTPVESMMLSDLKGYTRQITFKIVGPEYVLPQPNKTLFLNCFGTDSIKAVDARYFPVDSSAYRVLTWSDFGLDGESR